MERDAALSGTTEVVGTWWLRADDGSTRDEVWLRLGGGDISGSTGCNHVRGRYTLSGDGIATVGPVMTTLRACPEPVMAREQLVLAALAEGSPLVVEDGSLVVGTGDSTLRYVRIEPSLDGTWHVTSVHRPEMDAIVSSGRAMTLVIEGTTVSITTPDDVVAGTINLGDDSARGPIGFELGALPGSADEEDVALVAALDRTCDWRVDGPALVLLRADGGMSVTLHR